MKQTIPTNEILNEILDDWEGITTTDIKDGGRLPASMPKKYVERWQDLSDEVRTLLYIYYDGLVYN